jgi:O-antigen/teichoic acid export membrane protein
VSERFRLRDRTLRQHAARGTMVNAAFLVGVNTLTLLRGFVVAVFLTREELGIWGILAISWGTVLVLKQVGISDKYIQQDEDDQELAFQKAFTLEVLFTGAFVVIMAAAVPVFAELYGLPELYALGFVSLLSLPAQALMAPLWVYYRRMQFVRQRTLQAVDPVITFAVTVALAAGGAGYWSILVGGLCGVWATALLSVRYSPFRLKLVFDRVTAREYVTFSWPLLLAAGSGMAVAFGSVVAAEATLGIAAVGAITLASSITQYADRVDQAVTQTMYPAIAAVKERTEVLFESFVKSNRLTLMWGAPFGVGLALFAEPLVHHVLGDDWRPAIGLLQVFGLLAAVNHVGFNWSAFYRARGDTRPALVMSVVTLVVFGAVTLPLLITEGLPGLQIGMAVLVAASLATRMVYVRRLFPQFSVAPYFVRGLAPTVPAALAVLALRVPFLAEVAVFVVLIAAVTYVLERPLLHEAAGYLRARAA